MGERSKRRLNYQKPRASLLRNVVNAQDMMDVDVVEADKTIAPLPKVNHLDPLTSVNKNTHKTYFKKNKASSPTNPTYNSVETAKTEIEENTDEDSKDIMQDTLQDLKEYGINRDFSEKVEQYISTIDTLPAIELFNAIRYMHKHHLSMEKLYTKNKHVKYMKDAIEEIIFIFFPVFMAKRFIENQPKPIQSKESPLEDITTMLNTDINTLTINAVTKIISDINKPTKKDTVKHTPYIDKVKRRLADDLDDSAQNNKKFRPSSDTHTKDHQENTPTPVPVSKNFQQLS